MDGVYAAFITDWNRHNGANLYLFDKDGDPVPLGRGEYPTIGTPLIIWGYDANIPLNHSYFKGERFITIRKSGKENEIDKIPCFGLYRIINKNLFNWKKEIREKGFSYIGERVF